MKRTLDNLAYAIAAPLTGAAGRDRLAARLHIERRRRVPAPLVPAIGAFAAAVLFLLVTWSGWLYPLRPDALGAVGHPLTADPLFDNAWGGPTLVGAWFVHAMVALGIQVVCIAVLRVLNGLHGRTAAHAV